MEQEDHLRTDNRNLHSEFIRILETNDVRKCIQFLIVKIEEQVNNTKFLENQGYFTKQMSVLFSITASICDLSDIKKVSNIDYFEKKMTKSTNEVINTDEERDSLTVNRGSFAELQIAFIFQKEQEKNTVESVYSENIKSIYNNIRRRFYNLLIDHLAPKYFENIRRALEFVNEEKKFQVYMRTIPRAIENRNLFYSLLLEDLGLITYIFKQEKQNEIIETIKLYRASESRTRRALFLFENKTLKPIYQEMYLENKKHLQVSKTYPIDEKNVQLWIESQTKRKYKRFATLFRANMRHVSFQEFQDVLKRVCYDCIQKIIKENPPSVILALSDDFLKSNNWTSLLAWEIIGDYVTDIACSYSEVNFLLSRNKATLTKSLIIFCDDCMYTGEQSYDYINDISLSDESQIFMIVPFLSEESALLLKAKNALFSNCANQFSTLRTNIAKEDLSRDDQVDLLKFFGSKRDHRYTIYFDHKIADVQSIYDEVLLNPAKFSKGDFSKDLTLMELCKSKRYNRGDPEDDLPLKNRCPPTYYKQLKYTFRGKRISTLAEVRDGKQDSEE